MVETSSPSLVVWCSPSHLAIGWTPVRREAPGVGVPFAMACKLTQPQKEVVCLFGDGAFTLTGWDFEDDETL